MPLDWAHVVRGMPFCSTRRVSSISRSWSHLSDEELCRPPEKHAAQPMSPWQFLASVCSQGDARASWHLQPLQVIARFLATATAGPTLRVCRGTTQHARTESKFSASSLAPSACTASDSMLVTGTGCTGCPMARLLLSPKTAPQSRLCAVRPRSRSRTSSVSTVPPRSSTRIAAVWEKVDPPAATKCLAPLMMPSSVAALISRLLLNFRPKIKRGRSLSGSAAVKVRSSLLAKLPSAGMEVAT
jgi:hypothetical protein